MIDETINQLGCKARDRVTGFRGVITSVCFDLYGCVQYALTPVAEPGAQKLENGHWFDVHRLEVFEKERVMVVPDFRSMAPRPAEFKHGPSEKPAPNV